MTETQGFLFDPIEPPTGRWTDPLASHLAASELEPGNGELVTAIRRLVALYGPMSAWEIANAIIGRFGDRWQQDTIRTACARAGLEKSAEPYLKTPGGRRCHAYMLPTVTVKSELV